MISKIITVLFLIPLAIALIALSVANRDAVPVSLDVFNPGNPALTIQAPMFIWLFGAVAVGVVFGGVATWFTQGNHRKLERRYKRESVALRKEMESTKKEGADASGNALVMQRSS
ncbi:MAG: lipopolysaccharide assembly protein LapA domain-containing protein [Pseudomonadota bacterium]